MKATLRKYDILRSRISIEKLFQDGYKVWIYPLKIFYMPLHETSDTGVKILFAVPRRSLKSAVIRNRMKRRMKEAYRLNKKHIVINLPNEIASCYIGFLYVSKKEESFRLIQQAMLKWRIPSDILTHSKDTENIDVNELPL